MSASARAEPVGIGDRLRNAREAKGWSLQAVAELTHIRPVFLQALEDERFDRLPGPVYARGFLRAYAAALGLDADGLLRTYPQAFAPAAQPIVGHAAGIPIRPTARPSRLRRLVASILAGLLLAAVAVAAVGIVQLRQLAESESPPEVPTAPPQAAPPAPVVTAPAAPSDSTAPVPPEPAPAAPVADQAGPGDRVHVAIRASGLSWLRVTADGTRVFEGFIDAGEQRSWSASRALTVRVGNAPVVAIAVNGQPVRLPEGRRVWERTFKSR